MHKYTSIEERERIKKRFVKDYDKINEYKSHYGVIYTISANGLGVIYIGATSNYNKRIMDYIKASARKAKDEVRYIERAIYNKGLDLFTIEVIDFCESSAELYEKESYYINKYNTVYPNGLNAMLSGYTSDDDRTVHHEKPTGILADAESKRKRSRPIIAVDNINKLIMYCDSAKLFGEVIINTTKDIVARCCRKGMRCKGWFLFHMDKESIDKTHSDKLSTTGYNNEIYDKLFNLLKNNTNEELVNDGWKVFRLSYYDNDAKFLIEHLYSTEAPIPDITTTDPHYLDQFIVTPYDRSKDFGARRPHGFKVGYSYNVTHGSMANYLNAPLETSDINDDTYQDDSTMVICHAYSVMSGYSRLIAGNA